MHTRMMQMRPKRSTSNGFCNTLTNGCVLVFIVLVGCVLLFKERSILTSSSSLLLSKSDGSSSSEIVENEDTHADDVVHPVAIDQDDDDDDGIGLAKVQTSSSSKPKDYPFATTIQTQQQQQQQEVEQQQDTIDDDPATENSKDTNANALSLHPKICVDSGNVRTASVFITKTLNRFGGAVFDYVWPKLKCDPSWPMIRMMFQKDIVKLSSSQLQSVIDSTDLLIVHGDEYCRCPLEICAVKTHARQYFSRTYSTYLDENPSLLKGNTVGGGMYLPLGPRYEFKPVDPEIAFSRTFRKQSGQRKYLLNLIISPTSSSRRKLVSLLTSEDVKSQLKDMGETFIHVTPSFANNASEAKGFVKPEEYQEILLSSAFTLCPGGHNPEAFRIFEACESGSIPVLTLDEEYENHPCQDAFAPFIESRAPFVYVKSWSHLPRVLSELSEQKILEMQAELKKWYSKFWTEISDEFECMLQDRFVQRSIARGVDIHGELRSGCDNQNKLSGSDLVKDKSALIPISNIAAQTESEEEDAPVSRSKKGRKVKFGTSIPLITGCGRTGTLSVAEFLATLGIPSIHEGIKPRAVSVSWLYAAATKSSPTTRYPFESLTSWKTRTARMRLFKSKPLFDPVVHIVRHPLKVISSTRRCFCGKGTRSTILGRNSDRKSWAFVEEYVKMPYGNLPVSSTVRSMVYWLEWNKLITKNYPNSVRFRIEDLNPIELVKSLGLSSSFDLSEIPERIPRAPGHVSKIKDESLPDVSWDDLFDADRGLAQKIKDLAAQYGYTD